MTPEVVIDLFRDVAYNIGALVFLIILPSLLVGLVVAMFQAATQINEQTLSFLPRFLVTVFILTYASPWIGGRIYEFTMRILENVPYLIG